MGFSCQSIQGKKEWIINYSIANIGVSYNNHNDGHINNYCHSDNHSHYDCYIYDYDNNNYYDSHNYKYNDSHNNDKIVVIIMIIITVIITL